jgi:hypothetical protein
MNHFYKVILVKALLLSTIVLKAQQDDLTKYQSVSSLNKLAGKVEIYYPNDFKQEAIYTQKILEKAMAFYKAHLNIDIPVSAALFGPKEFNNFSMEKWGSPGIYNQFLPFMAAGPPAVMCLPVASGSALENMVQAGIKQNKNKTITSKEISTRLIAYIGIHELGHVITNKLEAQQEVPWYSEFMANYIAGAFTEQMNTETKKDVSTKQSPGGSLTPTNKHFGGMFNGSADNYIWWQASLQKRVAEMFPTPGISFINQLANLRNSQQYFDDLTMLVAMEQISPGFLAWAKREGHINEQDDEKIINIQKEIKEQVNNAIKNRKHLYTSSYSNKWTMGEDYNSTLVMSFLNKWENNSIDTSFFSEWVYYKYNWEKKDIILNKLKALRRNFVNWKIDISSIASLKSIDRNENWVTVYGNVNKQDLNGTSSVTYFTQWYKIEKDFKISFFKEFDE